MSESNGSSTLQENKKSLRHVGTNWGWTRFSFTGQGLEAGSSSHVSLWFCWEQKMMDAERVQRGLISSLQRELERVAVRVWWEKTPLPLVFQEFYYQEIIFLGEEKKSSNHRCLMRPQVYNATSHKTGFCSRLFSCFFLLLKQPLLQPCPRAHQFIFEVLLPVLRWSTEPGHRQKGERSGSYIKGGSR